MMMPMQTIMPTDDIQPVDKIHNDNTIINNKNIENRNLIVDSSIKSQVSTLTSALSQDTSTIEMESAIEIEDIPFSQCDLLKNKYKEQMNNLNLNNTIKKTEATVRVQPEVMSMLNPCTKEITKIESNNLQQAECHRWNSASKLEIFSSNRMFVK
jgi:hypothetical protein